jgi:zinc protease
MALAVAGDVDAPRVAAQVATTFAGMLPYTATAPAEIPVPVPKATDKISPVVFTEAEAGEEIVSLAAAVPRLAGDTPERRRRELAEMVAMALIERRLGRVLKVSAQIEAYCNHEVPGWTIPLLRLRTAPQDWGEAAVAMDTEVRRAIQRGFGAAELEEAVEMCRRKQRWAERDAPNRPAMEVAVALAHAMGERLVFPSPDAERVWLETASASLTLQECRDAIERLWPEAYTRLILTGPLTADSEPVWAVQRALKAVRKRTLEPYVPVATPKALLPTQFGTPGTVASQEYDAAKDCWLVQFDNGVKLNFKATPFEQGKVRVRVGFGYGLLGTEPGHEGLVFGIAALCYGNLANLDSTQERELLTRSGITTTFGFGADRLGFSANCPASGFATALRLFAARLTAADAKDGEARTFAFIEEQLTRYDRTSAGVAEDRLREYIFGEHHALTRPRRSDTTKLSYADLWHWVAPQLANSPLEITVVGDIGLDEAIAEVSRTLGALPLRSTVDQLADRRLFTPGKTPQRIEVRFQGKRAVASVALAWHLYDVVGLEDDCRMRLLASVLEDRIRVRLRQEMGKTYTPVVGLMAERALSPALLFLRCRIETAPRQIERVSEAAKAVVDELLRSGITAEELERAREPLVRQAEENATSNSWWLFALDEAQTKPQFVEGQGRQRDIYGSITRAELDELARLLFSPDRLCEVQALPE